MKLSIDEKLDILLNFFKRQGKGKGISFEGKDKYVTNYGNSQDFQEKLQLLMAEAQIETGREFNQLVNKLKADNYLEEINGRDSITLLGEQFGGYMKKNPVFQKIGKGDFGLTTFEWTLS